MNRTAALAVAAFAVVAIVVAALVWTHRAPVPATGDEPSAPSVPIVSAAYGTFTEHVTAQGRVGAPAGSDAKLAFAGSGIVAAIDVHVGDRVAAGTALARLDTGGLSLDLTQAGDDERAAAAAYANGSVAAQGRAGAQAHLSAARAHLAAQTGAKLAADRAALARAQALYAGGVAAEKDVEAARQQLAADEADAVTARADVAQAETDVHTVQTQGAVAQAQLAAAQARLASARRNLANAVLRAPADGVVTSIYKHVGESADPSQPAIAIAPPSSDTITLTATGADARKIHAGDPVTIALTGRPGSSTGVVRSVVPSTDPATQTSTVVVDGVPAGAAPGDAVEASIAVGTQRGIVIPTAAVVDDPQTGKAIVFVRKGTSFTAREIWIAAGDDRRSLVASGLRAGERIAGEGAYDLLAPSGGGD